MNELETRLRKTEDDARSTGESRMVAQTLQSPVFFGPGDENIFSNLDEFGLDLDNDLDF